MFASPRHATSSSWCGGVPYWTCPSFSCPATGGAICSPFAYVPAQGAPDSGASRGVVERSRSGPGASNMSPTALWRRRRFPHKNMEPLVRPWPACSESEGKATRCTLSRAPAKSLLSYVIAAVRARNGGLRQVLGILNLDTTCFGVLKERTVGGVLDCLGILVRRPRKPIRRAPLRLEPANLAPRILLQIVALVPKPNISEYQIPVRRAFSAGATQKK
jgi:hypothetical protein